MGITGLLPFLDKASKPVNISQYSGCTVAVDTYCWLHKGAFSCAEKLARGEQTDQYVVYCMKFVNMLVSHNIKPILVFDGRHLPAKAETEKVRKDRRETNRKKAAELLRADRVDEARTLIRRCVDVTHQMASALMDRCHNEGVDCIVAPYEADAQLAFFSISGIAHIIITEDSDLLLFGCKKVIFKMDVCGNGLLVDQCLIPLAMKEASDKFSLDRFRYMCILSGCDYLPSLPGIGLAKACKFIKRTADDNICRALSRLGSYLNMNNLVVSQEYKDKFQIAVAMFKYQPVYDPFQRRLTTLTPLPEGEPFPVDEGLSPDTSLQLALGNLNPFTLVRTNNWDPDNPKNNKTTGWNSRAIKNSIWSSNYQPPKQLVKKILPKFDQFVTKKEKTKHQSERSDIIEVATSPKKKNVEEELLQLRSEYGIKSPLKKVNCLQELNNIDEIESNESVLEESNFKDVDELFDEVEEMLSKQNKNSSKNNPRNIFSIPTSTKKTNTSSPSSSALSKMSKLSSSINEINGEFSRYFSSDYKEPKVSLTNPNASSDTTSTNDNPLKDIMNSPTKIKSEEDSTNIPETTTPNRRNIFSTSPHQKKMSTNITSVNQVSPGSLSFLNLLDTLVSPREVNEKIPKVKEVKTSPPKKQTKLTFFDQSTTCVVDNCKDTTLFNSNAENIKPLKITAVLKTSPVSGKSLPTKSDSPRVMNTLKSGISHKIGPAKTIGLKRKKSSNNDVPKSSQPSIFEMFAFQPKAKLKIQ